jgi:hypothetical protein
MNNKINKINKINELYQKATLIYNPDYLNAFTKKKLDKFLLDNETMIVVNAKIHKKTVNRKRGAIKAKMTKFINKIKQSYQPNRKIKQFKEFIELFTPKKPTKLINYFIRETPLVILHLKSVQELKNLMVLFIIINHLKYY